jgi:hypothetical protein
VDVPICSGTYEQHAHRRLVLGRIVAARALCFCAGHAMEILAVVAVAVRAPVAAARGVAASSAERPEFATPQSRLFAPSRVVAGRV